MDSDRALEFRPATQDVFEDVVLMLGPKRRPDAIACWCLTYRDGPAAVKLTAQQRRDRVFELCGRAPAPGILAYAGAEVVGWVGVAPRAEVAELRNTDSYPRIDEAEPWSIFCVRVRGGHRGHGIGSQLLDGAISFAKEHGATLLEAYPLDTEQKVDAITSYPGLRSMFERVGFGKAADAKPNRAGIPRVIMRLDVTRTE